MTNEEIQARKRILKLQEAGQPLMAWWLSFATGHEHLGAVVIEAPGLITAVERARESGQNPGGEIHGYAVSVTVAEQKIPRSLWGKLRTAKEWEALGIKLEKVNP